MGSQGALPAVRFVDAHTHLDAEEFRDDVAQVIERAREAGVTRMLTVGYDRQTWLTSRQLAEEYGDRGVCLVLGIHPNSADETDDASLARLAALAQGEDGGPRALALGETGLDYYWDRCPREVQKASFRAHLALARELDLPVVIHNRDAHEDVMSILRAEGAGTRGQMHSFSGDVAMAEECIRLGYMISLSGPVTFPRAANLHQVAQAVPLERLLLETDAPYLSPAPYRGKRNEPARIPLLAARVAELKGLTPEEVARATTANAARFFGLPAEN
jgi:TatD DNase family protein